MIVYGLSLLKLMIGVHMNVMNYRGQSSDEMKEATIRNIADMILKIRKFK